MTQEYEEKLIALAKEIKTLMGPKISTKKPTKDSVEWDRVNFNSKLSYLLGFILALEALEN